ncbi:MAG: endonuclease/exonuclease/phosphatase family protein [Candidatus Pacebacteria bacterium]|nr:endonuclease/exonuclease/phosphatase family protein [Candidatus Paceibacterota bacterium]
MIIKLIQWNIWSREKPENIVSFLKKSKADVICTQEIIRDSRKNIDVARYISKKLGFEYYYHNGDTWDNNDEKEALGNAIFSRFPITAKNYIFVQQPRHNPPSSSDEGRVYVEIKINVRNKILTIGTTHLSYSHQFKITKQRKEEIDVLISIIKQRKGHYLFAGDLNSVPNSYTITQLEKLFLHSGPDYGHKSWTTKPFEYEGFKENNLNWRLDYIFNTQDLCVYESKILDSQYSDHLPLQVKIKI